MDRLVEELGRAAAHQATLVAQVKASYASESSHLAQKDEEIVLLKAQLASTQAALEASNAYGQKMAEERMSLLAQVKDERAALDDHKSACAWAMSFMEQYKKRYFTQLENLRQGFLDALQVQEEKLCKMSIEYDEELYLI